MADLFKSKENEFYITLRQERYYSPGEDILGEVVLDLKKATKTNNIKVALEGNVDIGGRNISLFTKSVIIAKSPDGDKSYYLEPFTHRFPFLITIPTEKEYSLPSTLEISKLLKVSYRLVATYNKYLTLESFCPTASSEVTILEKINVEDADFIGEQKSKTELLLTGETRKVKVSTVVGKRAAVIGDVVPISIKIEHIGVFVRDKAISIQLLRSVYYGKNKSELFGPKPVREVTANIEISGPTSFTKTFDLRLAIPSQLCPTVDKSSTSFKIEYTLRVAVNLNEENPLRPETAGDIVIFNFPFTIGTYPRLAFNIDDDDDDDDKKDEVVEADQNDDIVSNHSSEYDQVAETMKDLVLETSPPQMVQQETPSSSLYDITPLKRLDETEVTTAGYLTSPIQKPAINKPNTPEPIPRMEYASDLIESQSPTSTSVPTSPIMPVVPTPPPEHQPKPSTSPPLTRPNLQINPSHMFNDYQPIVSPVGPSPTSPPMQRQDSVATMHPTSSTSTVHTGLGRQDSVRWIVRNEEAVAPAAVAAGATSATTSPNIPPALPPRPTTPVMNNNHGFSMPTPSLSQPTASSLYPNTYHHHHPQPGTHHHNHGNYPPLQSSHSSQTSNMPMPQYHQFPPYTNNHLPPYGYNQHYDYNHPPHNNSGIAFPVPQQPGYSGGFMGMPSHQNYRPQPSPYYNH